MSSGTSYAPFRDVSSFDREEQEAPAAPPRPTAWSPFLSVYEYESADGESFVDQPEREAYTSIVNELYDEEFDESLYELLNEARSLHENHLADGHSEAEADRLIRQHFSQLIGEAERMVEALAHEFSAAETIVESEVDSFVERYAPSGRLEASFEDFIRTFAKKIGKGVRAAAGGALKRISQVALGPILGQVRLIVNPMLTQVMQRAIGQLPPEVRPAAHTLAHRLGLAPAPAMAPVPAPIAPAVATIPLPPAPLPSDAPAPGVPVVAPADTPTAPPLADPAGSPVQADAGANVTEMQLEFDERLAEALLGETDVEMQLEVARARNGSAAAVAPVFSDLDRARAQFVEDLEGLREGENPEPYIQNFLPAVLPAVRIATRLIGRPRLVNLLAGVLGRVIGKMVGPAQTPALSRAIVDAGLKLLSLEIKEEDETRLASSAIAATVEETVRRVASLPDQVLEDQQLLEGFTLEAFEQAAAANLPALFSESTYRRRPDLLEGGINAAWVMLPVRRPRYKRCSRTFNVRITPQMAEAIDTFEDTPLAEYLQDQLGVAEGEEIEAEVHLFETVPGSTVADIVRFETETLGLGAPDAGAVSQFHALTPEAAGVLLGRPALGRRLPPGVSVRTVPAGQRLYVLAGRRVRMIPGVSGRRRVRRLAHVNVLLDAPHDRVRVCVYLSEVKAQRLAVRLRQQAHAGSITVGFTRLLARRLPPILRGRRRRRLRIVHPGLPPGAASIVALERLGTIVPPLFIRRMQEWLVRAFADFVKTGTAAFLAAAQDPSDGVTLAFTIDHPPGLKELCASLVEKGAPSAKAIVPDVAAGAPPSVRVEALPGHKCD